MAVKNVQ